MVAKRKNDVGICFEYDVRALIRNYWLLNIQTFHVQAYERNIAEDEMVTDGIIGIKTIEDLPENIPLIIISPKNAEYVPGEIALPAFKHPQKVIYYFGSDKNYLSKEELGNRTYQTVYIPIEGEEQFWAPQAASIVLYDRFVKQNYGNRR
ncbi:hypothetical protein HYZ78_03115 [Candidatus Microgenomates bacterium]|nr:hypothetical protein [Candidatus Microgenomates bacterium]